MFRLPMVLLPLPGLSELDFRCSFEGCGPLPLTSLSDALRATVFGVPIERKWLVHNDSVLESHRSCQHIILEKKARLSVCRCNASPWRWYLSPELTAAARALYSYVFARLLKLTVSNNWAARPGTKCPEIMIHVSVS